MTLVASAPPPQADVFHALRGVEIRSYIPGRLRLKIPALSEPSAAKNFSHRLTAGGTAQTVEVNTLTQSVLVVYDKHRYSQREFLRKVLAVLGVDEATLAALDAMRPTLARVAAANGAAHHPAERPAADGQVSPSFFSWFVDAVNATGSTIVSMVTMPTAAGVAAVNGVSQHPTDRPAVEESAGPSFFAQLLGPINAAGEAIVSVAALPFTPKTASPAGEAVRRAQPEPQEVVTLSPEERASLQELKWTVKNELPGRLRLHHPLICRYALIAQKVEFTLVNLDGVNDYAVSGISSNIRVDYDIGKLSRADLLEILSDSVRTVVRESDLKPDESLRQIALSSANLVL